MPTLITAQNPGHAITVTIANGASLSAAVFIPLHHTLIAIVMPAAWDAAALTFSVSFDASTYGDLYSDAGTEATVATAAGRIVYVDGAALRAVPWLKIRSGTAAVPVNQTAQRVLTLITRPS